MINIQILKDKYNTDRFEHIKAAGARDAAVLIPLIEDGNGRLSVLFEVRSSNIRQGGEICFPGGRVDSDEAPEQTVRREIQEELLTEDEQLDIISPLFTMNGVGDAFIYSYLGLLKDYEGGFSEDEVGSVFSIPLDRLLTMTPRICPAAYVIDLPEDFPFSLIPGGRDYKWYKRRRNFYFYETEFGVIWGMTGELLFHFLKTADRLLS